MSARRLRHTDDNWTKLIYVVQLSYAKTGNGTHYLITVLPYQYITPHKDIKTTPRFVVPRLQPNVHEQYLLTLAKF